MEQEDELIHAHHIIMIIRWKNTMNISKERKCQNSLIPLSFPFNITFMFMMIPGISMSFPAASLHPPASMPPPPSITSLTTQNHYSHFPFTHHAPPLPTSCFPHHRTKLPWQILLTFLLYKLKTYIYIYTRTHTHTHIYISTRYHFLSIPTFLFYWLYMYIYI